MNTLHGSGKVDHWLNPKPAEQISASCEAKTRFVRRYRIRYLHSTNRSNKGRIFTAGKKFSELSQKEEVEMLEMLSVLRDAALKRRVDFQKCLKTIWGF